MRDSDLHPLDDTVFEKVPYTKDQLGILLPSDHPKAALESISLKELSGEDFVILNQGTLLHQLFLSLCASCGFQPNIVLECKRMDSIFDLVSQHMGISLLTDRHFGASVRASAAGQHLKLIPLEQLHKVSMGKGYARISNKALIEEIAQLTGIECNGIKVPAQFDEREKMLIIDLNNPV